jgi:RNA polymerase sporulation-specific sigma factor
MGRRLDFPMLAVSLPPPLDAGDDELVSAAQHGDRAAYNQLLLRYHPFVKQRAVAYFLPGGSSDDLVQEGMVGLCKAVRDYRAEREASFTTFAALCVRRQISTAIASATRLKHRPLNRAVSLDAQRGDPSDGLSTLADTLPATGDIADQVELRQAVRSLAAYLASNLSSRERSVLSLHLDGRSYEQIAARLGADEKAVDNALQRLRRKALAHLMATAA